MTMTAPTPAPAPTAAQQLRARVLSPARLLLDLADGHLPPALQDPAVRWQWAADLLTHPTWGLVTLTPQHRSLFFAAADLCVQTAAVSAPHVTGDLPFSRWAALTADWRDVDADVTDAIAALTPGDENWETLDVVLELVTDALDLVNGHEITGSQMICAAFTAHITGRGTDVARETMTAALTHADTLADTGVSAVPHLRAVS